MQYGLPAAAITGLSALLRMVLTEAAHARYTCAVKATADGFVALRAGPGVRHRLIARMRRSEVVGLLHPPKYEKIVRKGAWLKVCYVPGSTFGKPARPGAAVRSIPGWVNGRLLDCHE